VYQGAAHKNFSFQKSFFFEKKQLGKKFFFWVWHMKQWNNRIFFEKSTFEKNHFEKKYFGKKNFSQKFSKVRPIWVWPIKQWNNRRIDNLFLKIKI